jgi:hypothetical protein
MNYGTNLLIYIEKSSSNDKKIDVDDKINIYSHLLDNACFYIPENV